MEVPSLHPFIHSLRKLGWIYTTVYVTFLSARRLLTEGLFGDGLCYAAIARNLSMGRGDFWNPFYSTSFWLAHNVNTQAFYEQPPLMFGMQAFLFQILGDTIWTEKIYSALVLLLTIVLIVQLWKQLLPADHPLRALSWLPVLTWFSCRLVAWGTTQNLLDTTMSLFCLLAVWLTLIGMQTPRTGRAWLAGIGAVGALLAAFLTKGPVSLHVLGVPVLYGLLYEQPRSYRATVGWTLGLTVGFTLLLGLLCLYDPARHNLTMYLQQQLLAALSGKREITTEPSGRLYVLQVLMTNVAWSLGVIAVLWGLRRWTKADRLTGRLLNRGQWFWLAVGMSVVLPMLISEKQYEHYVLPAMPYVGLGLAVGLGANLLPLLLRFRQWYTHRTAIYVTGILAGMGALLFVRQTAGTTFYFDRPFLTDVHTIGRKMPYPTQVGVFPDVMRHFPLHPYLQRYYRIDMATINQTPEYALVAKPVRPQQADSLAALGYQPVPTPMRQFSLYQQRLQNKLVPSQAIGYRPAKTLPVAKDG